MSNWKKEIWFMFRTGHSVYLVFFFSFGTFITVTYKLLLEEVEFLQSVIPSFSVFLILLLTIYFPVAIILGNLHLKKQTPVEYKRLTHENPYTYYVIPDSKDSLDFNFRLFEIDMLELVVNEVIKDEKKRLECKKQFETWRRSFITILEGKSTKEL